MHPDFIRTGLSGNQLLGFTIAFIFALISIILFVRKNYSWSILFLFASGLLIRFTTATLNPYLSTWDEQYHALVARNMMEHPFKPMLYLEPVLDYDYKVWISNHVWLHKQPWFLWQISLFFKMFGVDETVLRWPTAIMFSLLILVIYRIGKLLADPEVGWLSAFLYTFSLFYVDFVSGGTFSDHNDAAFIFYVTLSILAWLEYENDHRRKWIFLIGLLAGIAFLNKMAAGLLVYAGWPASLLFIKGLKGKIAEAGRMFISLFVTVVVALPWQLYILQRFPAEALHEFGMFSAHLTQGVETHRESVFYYLEQLPVQFGGRLVYLFLLPGLFLLFRSVRQNGTRYGLLVMLILVYLVFSLAGTRMPMYCGIVFSMIFLALGAFTSYCIRQTGKFIPAKWMTYLLVPVLGYLAVASLDMKQLDNWHSVKNPNWKQFRMAALVDKYAGTVASGNRCVVFNCGVTNSVMYMFYNGTTAYGRYPTPAEYRQVKDRKLRIAVFSGADLPVYLKEDPEVRKIYLDGFQGE